MNTLIIAILSIVFSVTAQFALKAGMSSAAVKAVLTQPFSVQTPWTILTNKFIFAGFCLYGLGAIVWLAVLTKWDVSKAYPLVGLGFALTVIIGALAGEQVTLVRSSGVALICAGVFLVAGRS
jgi:multidrug transporter EmrE-like cation transporter